jgi:hypothetical protein
MGRWLTEKNSLPVRILMHQAAFWLRSFQFSCDTLDVSRFKKHQVGTAKMVGWPMRVSVIRRILERRH